MSQSRPSTDRTDPKPTDPPNYHEIAARLTADAEELRLFVEHHPAPTAPIVLGWAEASPEHREAVEVWLTARDRRHADRVADLRDTIDEYADRDDADRRVPFTPEGRQ